MTHLTSRQREDLYDRCRGEAEYPTCNLCLLPITRGQEWDESHNPYLPRALGGLVDGIAHRKCNRDHGAQHDVPLIARITRLRQKDIGAFVKRSRPIIGSKRSGIKVSFNRPPVWRDSGKPLWERR